MKIAGALCIALAGCSSSSGSVVLQPASETCSDPVAANPLAKLISPVANSVNVRPTTVTVAVSTGYTVTAILIAPAVNGTNFLSNVTASGAAANGFQNYTATVSGTLATATNYQVGVDATYDPAKCPQLESVSAGQFNT